MNPSPQNTPASQSGRNLLLLSAGLVVILAVGAALGYGISRSLNQPVQIVVTATPAPGNQAAARPATAPPATSSPGNRPTPSIMDLVLSDARHFQGNADAPVTMIEFSDFK